MTGKGRFDHCSAEELPNIISRIRRFCPGLSSCNMSSEVLASIECDVSVGLSATTPLPLRGYDDLQKVYLVPCNLSGCCRICLADEPRYSFKFSWELEATPASRSSIQLFDVAFQVSLSSSSNVLNIMGCHRCVSLLPLGIWSGLSYAFR